MCADALALSHFLKARQISDSAYPFKKTTAVGNFVNVAQGNLCHLFLFCLTVICISEVL